ncbi:MAG: anti-sigma regulatory factor [Ardenticatenaceae bacterium]|nr:anti-sigma regulatory factor [Ardenticatenaceae bacterium]HBY93407.1 ATP-binding protein [Chloroflexota bacterium]
MVSSPLPISVDILREEDIIIARQRGREMARELGFGLVDQSRIATSISELTRNILRYAQQGTTVLRPLDHLGHRGIEIVCQDRGPGIPDVQAALEGQIASARGLGIGLSGTRRLMDEMEIESVPGQGTKVTIRKWLR